MQIGLKPMQAIPRQEPTLKCSPKADAPSRSEEQFSGDAVRYHKASTSDRLCDTAAFLSE
jgi:hypothetical protein